MIEILKGFPDHVVAVAGKGQVTRQDYETVFIPAVESALGRHQKIRCYYELGEGFTGFGAGAAWEDFKLGIEHFIRWERVAVVTNIEWIKLATRAFAYLMPGQCRIFAVDEAAEARHWIAAESDQPVRA